MSTNVLPDKMAAAIERRIYMLTFCQRSALIAIFFSLLAFLFGVLDSGFPPRSWKIGLLATSLMTLSALIVTYRLRHLRRLQHLCDERKNVVE